MSSLCSQLGNMLVKVRGSRPAWIRYALGGFFSFFSVETKWFERSSWVIYIFFFINVQSGWNCCLRMLNRLRNKLLWMWHQAVDEKRIPLQYCSTVSMAHFLSESQRICAEPVLSPLWGHQPCHRYTSWWLSTRNRPGRQRNKTSQRHLLTLSEWGQCR